MSTPCIDCGERDAVVRELCMRCYRRRERRGKELRRKLRYDERVYGKSVHPVGQLWLRATLDLENLTSYLLPLYNAGKMTADEYNAAIHDRERWARATFTLYGEAKRRAVERNNGIRVEKMMMRERSVEQVLKRLKSNSDRIEPEPGIEQATERRIGFGVHPE